MNDRYKDFPPEIHPSNYKMKANPPKTETPPQMAISEAELQTMEGMSKEELIKLVERIAGAMWGIGLKSREDREEAMLLKLSILSLTSKEAKDVVSTAKEYFDRARGKPPQSIDLNQKIGIVAIVMEAAKQRQAPLIDTVADVIENNM